jgi:uncharacterized protein (DUF427 family)
MLKFASSWLAASWRSHGGPFVLMLYIPREDADMSMLERTKHYSYCPYKGDCTYYSIPAGGQHSEYAVWTYEHPYDAVASIRNHLAFYPSRVDAIEVLPFEEKSDDPARK